MIAWIYIGAVTVVLCVEINVVRAGHLYPRALLTPFTDNVNLTTGDEHAYARSAKAQRQKGFEQIDVNFDGDTDTDTQPADQRAAPDPTGDR